MNGRRDAVNCVEAKGGMNMITENKKCLVVSFPGGRGDEIPLLYFGAKVFEDKGYKKLFVRHPESGDNSFEALCENARKVLNAIPWDEYEDVVFVAKSIGTEVACILREELGVNARMILLTPLPQTLPYMKSDSGIALVAAGAKDRYLGSGILREHCEREQIPCYIEPNVGHRMEVMNDLGRNLEIVGNVIGEVEKCSGGF